MMPYISDMHAKPIYADNNGRTIALITVALNSTLTILALLFLQEDIPLFWGSFTPEFQRTVLAEHNYSNPLTIRQVLEFSQPGSPHYHLVQSDWKHMVVEYGTAGPAFCLNDPVPSSGLPSILRAIEFHSLSQLLLRFTVLFSLSIRPILASFRSLAVYNHLPSLSSSRFSIFSSSPLLLRNARGVPLLNRVILFLSPFIYLLVLISGYFITAWQQDLDFHSVMWVPFYSFAALYTIHMILQSTIELMEPERITILRVLSRFCLVATFVITSIIVLKTNDEFLGR
ncbi:hypothetical protein PMAYCL1PPCAC_15275, partial [Pristionchus mayeri]